MKTLNQKSPWTYRLQIIAWAAAVSGYFAPWIAHQAAALALNPYDLFRMLPLMPGVEAGALAVNAHALRLPLIGLGVALPWLLAHARWGWRWSAALLGMALTVMTLPPYPQIQHAWTLPQWRAPFWWGLGGLVATAVSAWLAPRLPALRNWSLVAWLALTIMPALITFQRARPALHTLYAAPIRPGWGYALCAGGSGVLLMTAWLQAVGPKHQAVGPTDQAVGPTDQAVGPTDQAVGPQRGERK
jgi:hypothetical protein